MLELSHTYLQNKRLNIEGNDGNVEDTLFKLLIGDINAKI